MTQHKTPLEDAIAMFKTETALARAIGYSQHAVWHAAKVGRVSPAMAVAIHRATGGKVPKEALRPDIFISDTTEDQ
jgi:DNA-binding transcriptional regulator YdaS (Cro superfamily)